MDRGVILVVDDDEGVQALMRVLLTRKKFRVEAARNGEEAFEKIRLTQYATILLDLMMPRLNGFELLGEIKALYPNLLRRIIVFTAVSESALRHFDESEVFRLIRKPFDIDAVLGAIHDCIAQQVLAKVERRGTPRSVDPLNRAAVPES